jgi:signal transduction histidine kinase/CheY-like chemotaxis protein
LDLTRRGPLLIGGAVILPLLIFVAILIAFSSRERRRQVEEQAVVEASMLMVEADASLSRTLGSLDALAAFPAFAQGDLRPAYARARDIAALNPDWVTVTLTDLNSGEILFDLRRPVETPPLLPEHEGGFPPGSPATAFPGGISGTGQGCPCVLAHRIVQGTSGHRYAVTAMVDPRPFQRLILTGAAQDKVLGLVDRQGRFIARSIGYRERLGTPGSNSLRSIVAAGRSKGIYHGTTLEGFVSYTAFARSPLSGWSVHIAFAPTLLDVPRRRMLTAAAVASTAALALALFLIWFTLRQLAAGRQVEARLQETQKLEALGRLTGGIAHDFNNLLTPILGGLDLLARKDTLDERSRRLADGALASARKAAKLTRQLLAFSRRQRMEIEPVDLDALLAELEPLLRQSVDSSVKIEIAIAEAARCVLSDRNQLELALLNLVLNARDAMPAGGTVRISAAPRPGTEGEEQKIAIIVADDGQGMAPDVLRRAPEPFYTTKPVGSGTGLGLAQVYGIVEQSGGTLAIDSEAGKGTVVTILLPGGSLPPAAEPSLPATATAVRTDARLLVCDDDDSVRGFVARTLEDAGYKVEAVGDGRTAVESVRNNAHDLLVVDFAMPGMNGAEVARRVRDLPRPPAVLMITGYADSDVVAQAGRDMMVLRKPFEADVLLAAVAEVLSKA